MVGGLAEQGFAPPPLARWLEPGFDGIALHGEASGGRLRDEGIVDRTFIMDDGTPVPMRWAVEHGRWRRPRRGELRSALDAVLQFGDTGPLYGWLSGWRVPDSSPSST